MHRHRSYAGGVSGRSAACSLPSSPHIDMHLRADKMQSQISRQIPRPLGKTMAQNLKRAP